MIDNPAIAAEPEASAPVSSADYAALDLLILLARRRRFLLRFTLGAAVLSVIVALLLPNWYTATTVVLPPAQSSLASALFSQLGASSLSAFAANAFGVKNPTETYAALFRTRTIEDALIQRYGLQRRYRDKTMVETRRDLAKHFTVIADTKDILIHINVEDHDPKLAAAMANDWVAQFRKLSSSLAVTEASQRRLFFQQQLQDAKQKLAAAEVALKNTEQSTGVLAVNSQAKSLIETAANLRAQVVAKQVQIQVMRSYATEDNPDLILAKKQLAALQAQLAQLGGVGKDPDSGLLVPKGRIPEVAMEYVRKLRDVKYYETVTKLLARQLELARLDEARQGAVIQVADRAVPPDKRSSPHRLLIVILATLGAFVLASGWCFFVDGVQKTLETDPAGRERIAALRAALSRGKGAEES